MGTIAAAQAVCCAINVRGCALGKLYLKEFVSKKLYLGKDVPWGKVEIVSKDSPLVRRRGGPNLPSELGPEPTSQDSPWVLPIPTGTFPFAVLRSEVLRHSFPVRLGPLRLLRLDIFPCLS